MPPTPVDVEQGELPLDPLPPLQVPGWAAGRPHAVEWWTYHRANPAVWDWLTERARVCWRRNPDEPVGMRMLIEVLRYRCRIGAETIGAKINNNYAPLYAEMMRREWPDSLGGLFRART